MNCLDGFGVALNNNIYMPFQPIIIIIRAPICMTQQQDLEHSFEQSQRPPRMDLVHGNYTNTHVGFSCDREDFWASPVKILVFASPTGDMLTSSSSPLLNWGIP